MILRKERVQETERGSTRSCTLENSLPKGLWSSRQFEYGLILKEVLEQVCLPVLQFFPVVFMSTASFNNACKKNR
jgi:hypothetical protein